MLKSKYCIIFLLVLTGASLFATPVNSADRKTPSLMAYTTISVAEAKEWLLNSSDQYLQSEILVLDVRTQSEYDAGYIEGAILIPHDQINTTTELPSNKSTPILVYCGSGMRSANASRDLDALGYNSVFNMDGGLIAWKAAGYFLTYPVATFKQTILAYSDQYIQSDLFILDARTQTEYNSGYIDGATLIPHTTIKISTDLPTNKTEPIYVYCGSGKRSANASQALEDLGYTVVRNMAGGLGAWKAAGYFVTIPVLTFKQTILDNSDQYVQPDLFILDARTQAEFDRGYIDGATLIPHTTIKTSTDLPTNKTEPIYVYCGSGKRSANASQTLEDLNYTSVRNVAGGLGAWKGAGYFVTIPVATAKTFIDTTPGLFILDARTQAEYDASYIVGATLIPHSQLASQASELPSNKTETILVYCGSGKRSANASQTLEDLGYTNVLNMAGGLDAWTAAGYPTNLNETSSASSSEETSSEEESSTEENSGFGFGLFLLLVGSLGVTTAIRRRKR